MPVRLLYSLELIYKNIRKCQSYILYSFTLKLVVLFTKNYGFL